MHFAEGLALENCFSDILNLENVNYYKLSDLNFIATKFIQIHNRFPNKFTKYLLARKFINIFISNMIPINTEKTDKSSIHIIFENNPFSCNYEILKFIKSNQPNAKFVFYWTNTISTNRRKEKMASLLSEQFYDLIITFDKRDAELYDLEYFEIPNSRVFEPEDYPIESDIYFCGLDKGRLLDVSKICDFLTINSFKCDFNVIKPKIQGGGDLMA